MRIDLNQRAVWACTARCFTARLAVQPKGAVQLVFTQSNNHPTRSLFRGLVLRRRSNPLFPFGDQCATTLLFITRHQESWGNHLKHHRALSLMLLLVHCNPCDPCRVCIRPRTHDDVILFCKSHPKDDIRSRRTCKATASCKRAAGQTESVRAQNRQRACSPVNGLCAATALLKVSGVLSTLCLFLSLQSGLAVASPARHENIISHRPLEASARDQQRSCRMPSRSGSPSFEIGT